MNEQQLKTIDLTRGAERLLYELGFATIEEFNLGSGGRVDLAAVDAHGDFTFIEVKSSVADFRGDRKWPEYLEYCDQFYFCVSASFPRALLEQPSSQPHKCGIIIADRFGGEITRPAEKRNLHPARRRAQTIQFARKAGERLYHLRETLT